ncbi:hypothetical protein [Nioella sp.]|uniref:hypothetical protein n=1 Tax=Nioella sp. TaxID=1912091 RepID=UPI0035113F2E
MKKTFAAALTAATLLTSQVALADEQVPTMSIDMVTQDTMTATEEADMLVPALFLMFFILVLGGNNAYLPG